MYGDEYRQAAYCLLHVNAVMLNSGIDSMYMVMSTGKLRRVCLM